MKDVETKLFFAWFDRFRLMTHIMAFKNMSEKTQFSKIKQLLFHIRPINLAQFSRFFSSAPLVTVKFQKDRN